MDSDFVPNKEFSPFPGKQADRAEEALKNQVQISSELLREMVEHYNTAIEFYRSNKTTPLELTLFPKRHAIKTAANIQTAQFLEEERGYLLMLLDKYGE